MWCVIKSRVAGPKQFALRRKEESMNELYAVIAFFVLIGLLVSRMKREGRKLRIQAGHSNLR
jgi:hypothetical protein